MTGPEHYLEAERILGNSIDALGRRRDPAERFAEAQVHATLALTAATFAAGYPNTSIADDEAWGAAFNAGVTDA